MQKMTDDIRRDLSYMTYAPVLFISALTGQRVDKLFEMVNAVSNQNSMRITTGMLNNILEDATARVQPPTDKGRRLKIYYMTQVGVKPPHFADLLQRREALPFLLPAVSGEPDPALSSALPERPSRLPSARRATRKKSDKSDSREKRVFFREFWKRGEAYETGGTQRHVTRWHSRIASQSAALGRGAAERISAANKRRDALHGALPRRVQASPQRPRRSACRRCWIAKEASCWPRS